MKICGMTSEEFTRFLDESFESIKRSTRQQEALHYTKERMLADDLERSLERLRAAADALESITGADYWPYPSYSDILYSVR